MQRNLRNRVASVTYEDADDADSLTYRFAAHYTYDVHGNVDTLIQENTRLHAIGHGYKRTAYNYDLISGKVNRADYQPGQPDRFTHRYEYDADNRILSAHTTRDGVIWEEDADYNYYKHGPLARMQMGERDVQGLDYVYTIQGWLKSVNSITLSETRDPGRDANNVFGNPNRYNGRDIFGFSLEYFNGDFQPIAYGAGGTITAANHYLADASAHLATGSLYNGNIAMIQQQVRNTGNPLLRKYGYDQLNRLASVNLFSGLDSAANSWTGATATDDYHEAFTYDANGNILTLIRNGLASQALAMDTFAYSYTPNTNRLDHVKDVVNAANYDVDIDDQDTLNYRYDAIGNLTKDISEGIDTILWTLYGKVHHIAKPDSNVFITFRYDPMGQRTEKEVVKDGDTTLTLYTRDASGNIMAVYTLRNGDSLKLNEVPLYGSSRLGVWNANKLLRIDSVLHDTEIQAQDPQDPATVDVSYHSAGEKQYELSNHLGNVLATVSDRKIPYYVSGALDHYKAEQITGNEYYAFGSPMPERKYSVGGYRFGFNGKEIDTETNGRSNHYDYGFRIVNTDLGRFLSVDPLFRSYPWYTPYQFAGNSPIMAVDLDGLEQAVVVRWYDNQNNYTGSTQFSIPNANDRSLAGDNFLFLNLSDNPQNRSTIEVVGNSVSRQRARPAFQSFVARNQEGAPRVQLTDFSGNPINITTTDGSLNDGVAFVRNSLCASEQTTLNSINTSIQQNATLSNVVNIATPEYTVVFPWASSNYDPAINSPIVLTNGETVNKTNAQQLNAATNMINQNPDVVATVTGNSSSPDQTGNNNIPLSTQRANTVSNLLLQNGVSPSQINNAGGVGASNASTNPNNNVIGATNNTQNAVIKGNIPLQTR